VCVCVCVCVCVYRGVDQKLYHSYGSELQIHGGGVAPVLRDRELLYRICPPGPDICSEKSSV
jgi:hypothetical protein